MLISNSSKEVRTWDYSDGRKLGELEQNGRRFGHAVINSDGTRVFLKSGASNVVVYDSRFKEVIITITLKTPWIHQMLFHDPSETLHVAGDPQIFAISGEP